MNSVSLDTFRAMLVEREAISEELTDAEMRLEDDPNDGSASQDLRAGRELLGQLEVALHTMLYLRPQDGLLSSTHLVRADLRDPRKLN